MDWTRYKRVIDSMKEEGIGQLIVTDSVSAYYLTESWSTAWSV